MNRYCCSECERPLQERPDGGISACHEHKFAPIDTIPGDDEPLSEIDALEELVDVDAPIPFSLTQLVGVRVTELQSLVRRADDELAIQQRRCGSTKQIDEARAFLTKALETL